MAAKLFWAVAACFIRFSLLVLYYRLLSHIDALQRRTWKWVLHGTTFFNLGIFFSYVFTVTFHCRLVLSLGSSVSAANRLRK